ncbi:MAG TPA: SRPBCC domain-containing protein [Xanthobacteraceae bacterium]|jgi:hypothetical protein
MRAALKTNFSVPQSPDQVWSVLIDYPSYARWNSFMREASGEVGVGKKLNITVYLSSGSKWSFKPKLLVVEKERELRWTGRLIVNGLFDGEHYWVLTRNASGGTDILHGENFKGLLVRVIRPEKMKVEFERMNRDMAAEIVRR